MFEDTKTTTAMHDEDPVDKSKGSKVQGKQMNSTPVDHSSNNEFGYPPVSSFEILCITSNILTVTSSTINVV